MELARKLAREMDAHRTVSLSRVYAPNEYTVWLSPHDRARYEGLEHEVIDELCAYLLEHARRENLILRSQPQITFHTDERLALGEFGIKAQQVAVGDGEEAKRPPQPDLREGEQGTDDDLQHGGARWAAMRSAPAPRLRRRARSSWRRGATARCRRRVRRSGAAASATWCSTMSGSRACMPSCVPRQPAGRSRI